MKNRMFVKYDISCFEKWKSSKKAIIFNDALYYIENCILDLTEKILNRAGELALENMSE